MLSAVGTGCGDENDGSGTSEDTEAEEAAAASVTPGQSIWVAVLITANDAGRLDADLATARSAVGDYYADRVVVKDGSCYAGLPPEMEGKTVLAIQDEAEHGVHAMYEEFTDDPPFYGEVTLVC